MSDALRVLTKLVALKRLKEEIDRIEGNPIKSAPATDRGTMRIKYESTKEAVWKEAKDIVDGQPS